MTIHLNIIDPLDYEAQVTALPGTWYDFGDS